ncbi:MAG: LytR C-terminal domain-containing protein [Ilumatobacteraceae bacterium]
MAVSAAVAATLAAACGGGDDAVTSTTQPMVVTAPPPTTVAPVPTAPPSTVTPVDTVLVTDGASVIVANASTINGAAGRLTDRLAIAGFSMVDAANSADTVRGLEITRIYFDPAVASARPIADSIKAALGGGSIEVLELVLPALTESGNLGSASVLVLMGNDIADKSLEELQGLVPPADESATEDTSTDDGTNSDDSGG